MMELMAACPTLQGVLTPIGTIATPTTAMAKIFSPYADDHWIDNDPLQGLVHPRPRVIIQHNDFSRQKLGTAYGGGDGSLFVTFEFKPDPAAHKDPNRELASFEESVGLILDEMEHRVTQDKQVSEVIYTDALSTHLNITKYVLVAGPASSFAEEELGETFYAAVFLMFYVG